MAWVSLCPCFDKCKERQAHECLQPPRHTATTVSPGWLCMAPAQPPHIHARGSGLQVRALLVNGGADRPGAGLSQPRTSGVRAGENLWAVEALTSCSLAGTAEVCSACLSESLVGLSPSADSSQSHPLSAVLPSLASWGHLPNELLLSKSCFWGRSRLKQSLPHSPFSPPYYLLPPFLTSNN